MTRVQSGNAGAPIAAKRVGRARGSAASAMSGANRARGNGASRSGAPQDAEVDALLEGFELGQIVSHLLRRAHFRAEELFSEQAGDRLNLTPRQKALLISCYRHPGANQSALAEYIALDRNTVAEMVSRMVRTGLLERSRDPADARSYRVRITRQGVRMLKSIMPIDPEIEAAVVAPLPSEYRALFLKCLRLMVGLEPVGKDAGSVDSVDGPG